MSKRQPPDRQRKLARLIAKHSKRRARRKRGPLKLTTRKRYVIVPKTQMRAKEPTMLANPQKVEQPIFTTKLDAARTFGDRSGAFQFLKRHPELAKSHWYRPVAA